MLPPQTPEILYYKITNRYDGDAWVVWAIDMLEAGFDTEHLRMLAGETAPYSSWRLQPLTDKVLHELSIDVSNTQVITTKYICYIIKQAVAGNKTLLDALRALKDFYYSAEQSEDLLDFFLIYYAWGDLLNHTEQFYWPGANRDNIEQITLQHFNQWLAKYCDG